MKTASISQTKNQLSALLDEVRQGETILILDRNRPVARLEPITDTGEGAGDARLARLERAGLLRRGRGGASLKDLPLSPSVRTRRGASALQALLAERTEGR